MTTIARDRYLAADGPRELVLLGAAGGSRLLVDRRRPDGADARLLAHLSADEPDANADAVSREYLADRRRAARRVQASDFSTAAFCGDSRDPVATFVHAVLIDPAGRRYALGATSGWPSELRWQCTSPTVRLVSAREVVGALESYEPVCALTRAAVARFRGDRGVSVATLSVELRRVETSPIVLNRRLREAVLVAVRDRGSSLSAIAMACGRVKYDRRGNGSGETSWLARRVGLLPSGPDRAPNPWVHSDTLALIARDGLGLAPREVELP